jgi:hypothetical protein
VSTSWPEMFNQYMRYYGNMNEFLYGYIERMKVLNDLYVESMQNIIRINNQYRELLKGNENANSMYKDYVDNLQKLNKQWMDSLWDPSLSVNKTLTDDDGEYDIPELIDELRTNYPLVSAILDKVPEMDLEEAGTLVLLVDGVRWLGKMHALRLLKMEDKTVTDKMMQVKSDEIRAKHPLLAAILDRIHQMSLKETYAGLLVLDALEHILKARQVEVIREKGL